MSRIVFIVILILAAGQEGFDLLDRGQPQQAREHFERSLSAALQQGDLRAEAAARLGLGLTQVREGSYSASGPELERSLELFERLGDRLNIARVQVGLAQLSVAMGDRQKGVELSRRALAEFEALGDVRGRAHALYNLAYVENGTRKQLIEQSLEPARAVGDVNLEGRLLGLWGYELWGQGSFAEAMEKLERAVAIFEQTGNRLDFARTLLNVGRVHRSNFRYEQALEYHRRAVAIQKEVGDRGGMTYNLYEIALVLMATGKPREAVPYHEEAVKLARQSGSPALLRDMLSRLGANAVRVENYARAIEVLEEASRLPLPMTGYHWGYLSTAYSALGRHREALEAAERGVALSDARAVSSALWRRAVARQRTGDLSGAVDDTWESLRESERLYAAQRQTDAKRRATLNNLQDLFTYAVELLHQSGRPERALEAAERGRARAFLDLLATREVEPRPADRIELASLQKLERELQARGLDPAEAAGASIPPVVLRGGSTELASLWTRWQSADPELRSLVTAAPPSAGQLARTAARLRSTLLSYWVGSKATHIWVVDPQGKVGAARVEVSEQRLRQLVRQTWAGLRGARDRGEQDDNWPLPLRGADALVLGDSQKHAWRELHRHLIQPVHHLLPKAQDGRLTIIPHGPLFQVSFAALQDQRGRYLVEQYALHYAPAGAVLDFTERKKQRSAGLPPRYLLVADPAPAPTLPNGQPLPALPGARREVQDIARLLPANAAVVLEGAQAHEEHLRTLLRDKTVLHLATHGIVRDDQPFDSFLALARNGEGDGRLTAREVYELDLQANLVVLSACRSGLGLISGDGIVGLTRAFFYAGTPSVVATLWDVADEPSYLLISHFYRELQRHGDKSRALRAAQLRSIAALRSGQLKIKTPGGALALPDHPLLWAGFVLVGEP